MSVDALPALIDRALVSLRGLVALLEAEHAALRRGDALAVKMLADDKTAGLFALSALLTTLRSQPWPAHLPANELIDLLDRCREQNRANGVLMNLQAARLEGGSRELGLEQSGYGRGGLSRLRAEPRSLASA